jgi:hypothetical protein
VCGGIDPTTGYADEELMSYSVKFYVATTVALETLVSGELEESNIIGSPTHGAIEAINDAIRALGSAGLLVTTAAPGTVNAMGATANTVFQSGAPTVGGEWNAYLELGATPATLGDVRLPDEFSIQKWGTGPVNVPILGGNAADDLLVGLGTSAGTNPPVIYHGANSNHRFYTNGNLNLDVFDAGIQMSVDVLRFAYGEVSPSIYHTDDPSVTAVADNITARAQGVSHAGGGGTSGNWLLRGGRGTGGATNTDGNVALHETPASWQSGEEILFISDCVLEPTANPAAGAFLAAASGAVKTRSSGGVVTTVSPVGSTVTIKRDVIAVGGQAAGGGTVDLLSYTIANGQILHVHVTAGARDIVTGDVASYERIATFEQTGGALALVGAVSTPHTAEEVDGWDATLLVVGAAAVFRGTGGAANATDWDIWAELTIVG